MNKSAKWIGVAFVVMVLAQIGIASAHVASAFHEAKAPEYRPSLSTPIAQLQNATVTCPASNASTPRVDVTTGLGSISSMTLVNHSTTCVQVGGSAVTSTTGGAVGNGCDMGAVFPFDGKQMYCGSSTTSSVDVQLLYGKQ